jgi:hypothetical protein
MRIPPVNVIALRLKDITFGYFPNVRRLTIVNVSTHTSVSLSPELMEILAV